MATLRERYEAALKSLDEATDVDGVNAAKSELVMLKGQMEAADEARATLAAMSATEPVSKKTGRAAAPRTLGQLAAKAAREQGATKAEHASYTLVKDGEAATPANQTSPGAASTGALTQLAQTIDANVVPQHRDQLVVRDLLGSEAISGNALTYFVEAADTTIVGGPAKVAEGGQKPKVHFSDPTPVTEALVKVASYYVETDELLEDYAWLASSIDSRALYLHRKWVNDALLNGTAATNGIVGLLNRSGIQTLSTSTGVSGLTLEDALFKAMANIQLATDMTADAIVINPVDYMALRLAKDSNGQYMGGGFFYGPYGQGGVTEQPPVWGMRTVVTANIAQGTALVGAFRQGASVITKAGGGLRVEATNSNEDDFTSNRVTIRVEERLALAVRYPAAFCKVTVASS